MKTSVATLPGLAVAIRWPLSHGRRLIDHIYGADAMDWAEA
ncbi:hypothetical protein ACTJNA_01750 [Klebsiella pneumoniae]